MNTIVKGLLGPKGYVALSRLIDLMNGGFVSVLRQWADVAQQRRDLAKLTDDQLKDIGLTSYDVSREIVKPFWKI